MRERFRAKLGGRKDPVDPFAVRVGFHGPQDDAVQPTIQRKLYLLEAVGLVAAWLFIAASIGWISTTSLVVGPLGVILGVLLPARARLRARRREKSKLPRAIATTRASR